MLRIFKSSVHLGARGIGMYGTIGTGPQCSEVGDPLNKQVTTLGNAIIEACRLEQALDERVH